MKVLSIVCVCACVRWPDIQVELPGASECVSCARVVGNHVYAYVCTHYTMVCMIDACVC